MPFLPFLPFLPLPLPLLFFPLPPPFFFGMGCAECIRARALTAERPRSGELSRCLDPSCQRCCLLVLRLVLLVLRLLLLLLVLLLVLLLALHRYVCCTALHCETRIKIRLRK